MSKIDIVDMACASDVVCISKVASTCTEHRRKIPLLVLRRFTSRLVTLVLLQFEIQTAILQPSFLGDLSGRGGGDRQGLFMKYGNKNCTREMFCLSLFRRRTAFTWRLHGFVEMLQTNVLTLCKVKNYETCLSDVKATAHSLLFSVFCLSYYTTCFQKFRVVTEIKTTQEGSPFAIFPETNQSETVRYTVSTAWGGPFSNLKLRISSSVLYGTKIALFRRGEIWIHNCTLLYLNS